MREKKKIAIFIDWFLPAFKAGGPITSVKNIIDALYDEFEFYVITSDRDLGDVEPMKSIETNKWIKNYNCEILYLDVSKISLQFYKNLFKNVKFDLLYFNSLYSFKFTILPIYVARRFYEKNRIILAVRGMLGKGALAIKSIKKKFFIKIANLTGLFSGITWHATSEQEKLLIHNYFGKKATVKIAENLPVRVRDYNERKIDKEIKFVFTGRILDIKNLYYALDVFRNVEIKDRRVIFDIYGFKEDEVYWEKCERLINEMPENIHVHYLGGVPSMVLYEKLKEYHFLFLPTKHENFGHSIFEAMSFGLPVIISTETPWRNLEDKKIGWDIPLTEKQKFIEVIEKCVQMKSDDYLELSKNAFKFAKEYQEKSQLKIKYKNLFNEKK